MQNPLPLWCAIAHAHASPQAHASGRIPKRSPIGNSELSLPLVSRTQSLSHSARGASGGSGASRCRAVWHRAQVLARGSFGGRRVQALGVAASIGASPPNHSLKYAALSWMNVLLLPLPFVAAADLRAALPAALAPPLGACVARKWKEGRNVGVSGEIMGGTNLVFPEPRG